MKLIRNTGDDRVIDEIRAALRPQSKLDIATATFSLFAFAETKELLKNVAMCRLVVPTDPDNEPQLFGSDADRPFRNRLNIRARAGSSPPGSTQKSICVMRRRLYRNRLSASATLPINPLGSSLDTAHLPRMVLV